MNIKTPAYVFEAEAFRSRVQTVQETLPGIPLCYAMKANAFLLHCLPDEIRRVEVCSPGELKICKRLGIPGEKIIYSGVVKGMEDTAAAIRYGAGMITAESPSQFELVKTAARTAFCENGSSDKEPRAVKVLLRLTSGNQFGMNAEDIGKIIGEYCAPAGKDLKIIGIHFYSGTQKKKAKQVAKDLQQLTELLETLRERYDYTPEIVEYGPGLAAAYFGGTEDELEAADRQLLEEAAPVLMDFAAEHPLSIELGRFFAAPAGKFYTRVVDLKNNCDADYALTDGGIHHLRYYGQTMSMQIPPIEVMKAELRNDENGETDAEGTYCLCGSLCTVADVLVREVKLPRLSIGDTLSFARCGAYSVTEASALFLSRPMPFIYLSRADGPELLRGFTETQLLNA